MERILFMAIVTLICLITASLLDKPLNKAIKKYEEDKRDDYKNRRSSKINKRREVRKVRRG